MKTPTVVVIGAGVGGLTAAALLLKTGYAVTVLEAHVYPGGCAGTFYHQGYRFDVGATLAGGFASGGPHARLAEMLNLEWPVKPVDPAWVVHLPNQSVRQWANPAQWREERRAAFPGTETFWQTQETLADIAWDVASRPFPWPPESAHEMVTLITALRPATLRAAPYLFSTIAHLARSKSSFKTFLDAQLLIAAQAVSDNTNALYGSAALDLPRRGVQHVRGGIGALAKALADWIQANGGQVLYRQTVGQVEVHHGRAVAVITDKGLRVECDGLLANLTPWALRDLLGDSAPALLKRETRTRPPTWGAFMLYLGLDNARLPSNLPDHHQVVVDPTHPLGEGNSVFLSLTEAKAPQRAPAGMRAATLSTHTAIGPWWAAQQQSETAYEDRKHTYTERLLTAAERAIPGLRQSIRLCLSGTPLTFEYYTGRVGGMVGGFPQTSLFKVRGPRTGLANVWLVGDSIFPGQSTAGVTLGGMRVAAAVAAQIRHPRSVRHWPEAVFNQR